MGGPPAHRRAPPQSHRRPIPRSPSRRTALTRNPRACQQYCRARAPMRSCLSSLATPPKKRLSDPQGKRKSGAGQCPTSCDPVNRGWGPSRPRRRGFSRDLLPTLGRQPRSSFLIVARAWSQKTYGCDDAQLSPWTCRAAMCFDACPTPRSQRCCVGSACSRSQSPAPDESRCHAGRHPHLQHGQTHDHANRGGPRQATGIQALVAIGRECATIADALSSGERALENAPQHGAHPPPLLHRRQSPMCTYPPAAATGCPARGCSLPR